MTSSDEGPGASGERRERPLLAVPPLAARLLPLACSFVALILVFVGLFDWDVPLTRFVRSLYPPVGSVPNPWLVQFSDLGDRLGKGESLVFLSLLLLAVGYGLKRPQWKDAGRQSLIAHGLVAVTANILKHAIGRPRPKFMDTGKFQFSPVSGSGWDSFPSGHAAASFAVATVLAAKFPRARWPILAVAVAIAASRIIRGSHFLTDVAGGAALGCVMGAIAVHPWREWRAAAGLALCRMTPYFVVTLAFVWTIVQFPSEAWPYQQLLWSGVVLTLVGLVGHVLWAVQSAWRPVWLSGSLTRSLVGLGLGMTTGSLFVTIAVLLVSAAHWLDGLQDQVEPVDGHRGGRAALAEGLFIATMLLALVASYVLKGIVPM
ncbi:MAG: phosphatase PAP2 family protein [Nitrospirota bacterium]|nr:phosphatase PAP2 family protein [Nitrospirota bacterium]MDP2381863.1 phosphatase PAP2 family protein [Nitrospirota bacterium]MDP3596821.1 phosphatase PAP2 family protein [Nitrospirota bacterium]